MPKKALYMEKFLNVMIAQHVIFIFFYSKYVYKLFVQTVEFNYI